MLMLMNGVEVTTEDLQDGVTFSADGVKKYASYDEVLEDFVATSQFAIEAAAIFNQKNNSQTTSQVKYLIIANLGMINTYWSLLLPTLAGTMGVFLMRQFMESNIPDAVLEAARIDGAGEWYIFWKIAMPNVKPAWLTLTLFSFRDLWAIQPSGTIFSEELKTLPQVVSTISAGGIAR
mgnify:CR=1 FL=1